ncbi:MAG TPA: hypothetical protein V6C58_09795 [Allocoleopsis sp.]
MSLTGFSKFVLLQRLLGIRNYEGEAATAAASTIGLATPTSVTIGLFLNEPSKAQVRQEVPDTVGGYQRQPAIFELVEELNKTKAINNNTIIFSVSEELGVEGYGPVTHAGIFSAEGSLLVYFPIRNESGTDNEPVTVSPGSELSFQPGSIQVFLD